LLQRLVEYYSKKNNEDSHLHLIYYSSEKTISAEAKYASYELKVLAIIKVLKRFRFFFAENHIQDCD